MRKAEKKIDLYSKCGWSDLPAYQPPYFGLERPAKTTDVLWMIGQSRGNTLHLSGKFTGLASAARTVVQTVQKTVQNGGSAERPEPERLSDVFLLGQSWSPLPVQRTTTVPNFAKTFGLF
jgi:hypothetical protein